MQLIEQSVNHKTFGKGVVTALSDNIITIHFAQGVKKFVYPEAFAKFLTMSDEFIQNEINSIITLKNQAAQTLKDSAQKARERTQTVNNFKITPNSQAAFDLSPLSKEQVFSSWTISTGNYLSGNSKGNPRVPNRLNPNSACLLTECAPNAPEKDRKVVGIFMVKEDFIGKLCKDGVIQGHVHHRIALNEDESLPFWDYFAESDHIQRWGNTAFKYFPNEGTKQILYDIKKALNNSDRKTLADEFYQYYCKINNLSDSKSDKDVFHP